MQNSRQAIWGIVTALVFLVLTLGALLLSVTEGNSRVQTPSLAPSSTSPAAVATVWQSSTPLVKSATPLASTRTQTQTPLPPTVTASPTASLTASWTASLASCQPPLGWLPYTVRAGDTLSSLAARYKRTSVEISSANCLGMNGLVPGLVIYLPPLPTRTPVPCGRPQNWVIYIVQPGDTLYRLGRAYGVTVAQLQRANCLSGTLITIGQSLLVPPWPPVFPSPTFDPLLETPTPSDTQIPTS